VAVQSIDEGDTICSVCERGRGGGGGGGGGLGGAIGEGIGGSARDGK